MAGRQDAKAPSIFEEKNRKLWCFDTLVSWSLGGILYEGFSAELLGIICTGFRAFSCYSWEALLLCFGEV
jgi:hypothetical protein